MLSLPAEKVKITLLYLLYIQLLFSKLNNFLKAIYPFECVFVHGTQMLPEIFKHFKGTSGHANGNLPILCGCQQS